MTRVTSTGINGVRLVHHISFANTVAYLFYFKLYFSKQCLQHSEKVSKNLIGNFYF